MSYVHVGFWKRAEGKGAKGPICPICKTRVRIEQANGKYSSYCRPCTTKRVGDIRKEGYSKDRPCARCRKSERAKSKSGRYLSYCRPCYNIMNRPKESRNNTEGEVNVLNSIP